MVQTNTLHPSLSGQIQPQFPLDKNHRLGGKLQFWQITLEWITTYTQLFQTPPSPKFSLVLNKIPERQRQNKIIIRDAYSSAYRRRQSNEKLCKHISKNPCEENRSDWNGTQGSVKEPRSGSCCNVQYVLLLRVQKETACSSDCPSIKYFIMAYVMLSCTRPLCLFVYPLTNVWV